jgi:alpha-L-fucosidase
VPIQNSPDLEWFLGARSGLFVYWGLYTLPARHEWVKNRERIPDEDYDRYFRHFDPDLFDPREWARAAKNAGMRYFVITTKHHEGFCLWDTKLTDYKVTNTPYGRDILGPVVDAFRAEGLRVGFYHSLIDWHHPDFPVDGLHPQRDDAEFKAAAKDRDIGRYADYLHGQVRELLDLVRELQPGIIVNDRLEIPGDLVTPEQYQPYGPMRAEGQPVTWEACQTFNGSWGYDRDNQDWKPAGLLARMLVDSVAKDGNLLLNVGPTGRGELEKRATDRMAALGEWLRRHGRAVYGAGHCDLAPPPDCRYTRRGDRVYLHVFAWPFRHLHLPDMAGRVEYAQFLHDASEIPMRIIAPEAAAQNTTMGGLPRGTLTLDLPVQRPDVLVPVIELFLSPDAARDRPAPPSAGTGGSR